jgi:hypothetical protein
MNIRPVTAELSMPTDGRTDRLDEVTSRFSRSGVQRITLHLRWAIELSTPNRPGNVLFEMAAPNVFDGIMKTLACDISGTNEHRELQNN